MKDATRESVIPREVELKLRLPPGSRAILEASSVFAAAPARDLHQITTYFDTHDRALNRAGLTLRVRKIGAARIQTVRSRANRRGVATSRNEWEWRIGQNVPDIRRLESIAALAEVAATLKGRLEPVFVTDIRRTVRLLRLDDNSVVEAAIDQGIIKAGRAREAVSELELESKAGPLEPLYRLAAGLQAIVPVWISPESKAARGWHLRSPRQVAGAQTALVPKLRRSARAAQGFREIFAATLGHLMANIGPTLHGLVEGVHEMRIAIRATRATLRLFEHHLDNNTRIRFDLELQRFGQIFGTARDWDVFCLRTLPDAGAELAAGSLRDLKARAELERQRAHEAVVAAIRGQEFTALVLGLAVWVEASAKRPNLLGDERMGKRLGTVAPALLDRVNREAMTRARHIGRLAPAELHRLRKSLKRLCFDIGNFAGLFPHRAAKRYGDRCNEVVDILGVINDAVVTRHLTKALLTDKRPALAKSAGALVRWSKRRDRNARHGLGRALKHLRAAPAFWSG